MSPDFNSTMRQDEIMTGSMRNGPHFRVPRDLCATPTTIRRVIIMGGCLLDPWKSIIETFVGQPVVDRVLFNNLAELPIQPPRPISDYDFQFISIPYRSIIPESSYVRLHSSDQASFGALIEEAKKMLKLFLRTSLRWNIDSKICTFVSGFIVPQQNSFGRLLPRHRASNLMYMTEIVNSFIDESLADYDNAYYLDLNEIASSIGKRYVVDDLLAIGSHGGLMNDGDFNFDRHRILPVKRLTETYESRVPEFVLSVWNELNALYRTVRQADAVKMVIVDLDDTLWRGVVAETNEITDATTIGWPKGVWEALAFLKKRGILLSIVSRNEEGNIRRLWPNIISNWLRLDDFAFIRINWKSKPDNIGEIIAAANILPSSVVFIDDNPVERESALVAFPTIRVIGINQYDIRRILLWSPETQVAAVTAESTRRTEMVQAQARRETERASMSREEFIRGLQVKITYVVVRTVNDPDFKRAFELLNKTNQFNTTGKRWSLEEFHAFLNEGGTATAFFVQDKHTEYGLVGLVLHKDQFIKQFVMSCRVLGLEVEQSVVAKILSEMAASGHKKASARMIETDANFPCRDLFSKTGFQRIDQDWVRDLAYETLVKERQ